jgi:hypothetical protein
MHAAIHGLGESRLWSDEQYDGQARSSIEVVPRFAVDVNAV